MTTKTTTPHFTNHLLASAPGLIAWGLRAGLITRHRPAAPTPEQIAISEHKSKIAKCPDDPLAAARYRRPNDTKILESLRNLWAFTCDETRTDLATAAKARSFEATVNRTLFILLGRDLYNATDRELAVILDSNASSVWNMFARIDKIRQRDPGLDHTAANIKTLFLSANVAALGKAPETTPATSNPRRRHPSPKSHPSHSSTKSTPSMPSTKSTPTHP